MLITLIAFLAILGLLVLVHEWGHFYVARRAGVTVEEFGLGLPPRAIGYYKNEQGVWQKADRKQMTAPSTIYSLNWTPLGGYVRIKGEDGQNMDHPDSFATKSIPKRLAIIAAGVIMNILLAMVLFGIIFTVGAPQVMEPGATLPGYARVTDPRIVVVDVLPDAPASQAGIIFKDEIVAVNSVPVNSFEAFQQSVENQGEAMTVTIKREGSLQDISVTPEILSQTDRPGIGVSLATIATVSYPWYIAWWQGIITTLQLIGAIVVGFYQIIAQLVTAGEMVGEVYGPVGIASLVGEATRMGFLYVVQFAATLSTIIAVMNLLPIPALDGGRIVFLLIEAVRGKAMNQKLEAVIHNIGFMALMALIAVVTFNDFARIFGKLFGG